VSGPRAIFGGPLEFNAAAVDLRIAMDGLATWFSEHATEDRIQGFEDPGLVARMLDDAGLVRAKISRLESAAGTLSSNAASLDERRAAYSKLEKAGRSLIKPLCALEKYLR
jgi:hypothetical protein